MRPLLLSFLVAVASFSPGPSRDSPRDAAPVNLSQLSESVPRLFLELVNDSIRGQVEPTKIRFSAPATLSLEDVRLLDATGGVVASIERAQIDVAVGPLLAGDLVISRLVLSGPFLNLHTNSEGVLNLLEALSLREKKQEAQGGDRFELRIEELVLQRGKLRYRQGETFLLTADNVQGGAEVRFDAGVLVVEARDTTLAEGMLEWPDASLPLSNVKATRWRIWNQRIDLEHVEGSVANAQARIAGSLSWEKAGSYQLMGELRTPPNLWPVKKVTSPFPLPPMEGQLRLSGTFAEPLVEVQASSAPFVALGYDVLESEADLRITRESLAILRGTLRLPRGDLRVTGTLAWDDLWLRLNGTAHDVPVRWLLGELRPASSIEGEVSGSFSLQGPARRTPTPISLVTTMTGVHLALPGVRSPSPLHLEASVELQQESVLLKSATIRGEGATLRMVGVLDLPRRVSRFEVQLHQKQPANWLPSLAESIVPKDLDFQGTLHSEGSDWNLRGEATLDKCDAAGTPLRNLRADLDVTGSQISLSNLSGEALDGRLQGQLSARSLAPRREGFDLAGQLRVTGGQLSSLSLSSVGPGDLRGVISVDAGVGGTLRSPRLEFDAHGEGVTLREERLGVVTAAGVVTRDSLQLRQASFTSEVGEGALLGEGRLGFGSGPLEATVQFRSLQLAQMAALQRVELGGVASGTLVMGGSVSAPMVQISSHVDDLRWRSSPLGGGPLEVTFARGNAAVATESLGTGVHSPRSPSRGAEDVAPGLRDASSRVELSTRLIGPRGLFVARGAYDIAHRLVNIRIDIEETDIGFWLMNEDGSAPPFSGLLRGHAHLYGPFERLNGELALAAPDIAFQTLQEMTRERRNERDIRVARKVAPHEVPPGAAGRLLATMKGGRLDGVACLYTGEDGDIVGPCGGGEAAWVQTQGFIDALTGRFSLRNRAYISETHLERWMPALRQIQGQAAASATAELRFEHEVLTAPPILEGVVHLQRLDLHVPDAPEMSLLEPTTLVFGNGGGRLSLPAQFRVGDEMVSLEGNIAQGRIQARLKGKLVLALAEVFTPGLTGTAGTLITDISLEGPLEAPALFGSIAPDGTAKFELASLPEPILWESGTLTMETAAAAETDQRSQTFRARQVALRLGEGNVRLDGRIELGIPASEGGAARDSGLKEWSVQDLDLHVIGDSLPVQNARQRFEVSFDTRLSQRGGQPGIAGEVDIHNGLIRDRFSLLENFLLARPSEPSLPIEDALARIGIDDVELDLRLRVQELNYEADVMTYPLSAPIQGDLHIFQSLLHPAADGALTIMGGKITFPSAQFEIENSSIGFSGDDKDIDPAVEVTARTELAPEITGCEHDLPVLLTIRGRSSSAFELQLSAEDGTEHSRLELLMSALFGQRLSICEAERGVGDPTDAAVRAFTGQLFSQTLTADLERSVRAAVGGDLQIKLFFDTNQVATDVRWQLGRRLALEGGAPLYQWNVLDDSNAQRVDPSEIANLRLRLLWLDHVPPFQGDLSFETLFSGQRDDVTGNMEPVTQGQVRYRAVEY